jgi:hypothetical protein
VYTVILCFGRDTAFARSMHVLAVFGVPFAMHMGRFLYFGKGPGRVCIRRELGVSTLDEINNYMHSSRVALILKST